MATKSTDKNKLVKFNTSSVTRLNVMDWMPISISEIKFSNHCLFAHSPLPRASSALEGPRGQTLTGPTRF